MSAQAYIAGLYPPTEKEIWNEEINWHPIPVHTVKNSLLFITKCPVYVNASEQYLQEKFEELKSLHKDVLDYIEVNSGVNISKPLDVGLLYDTLFIEDDIGFKLPEWTKSVFPEPLKNFFTIFVGRDGGSDLLKRLGEYFIPSQIMIINYYLILHNSSYLKHGRFRFCCQFCK